MKERKKRRTKKLKTKINSIIYLHGKKIFESDRYSSSDYNFNEMLEAGTASVFREVLEWLEY